MIKGKRIVFVLMTAFVAVMIASAGSVYAAQNSDGLKPIRVVHNVKVDDTKYCVFVQHDVVFTPEEIVGFEDDDELAAEIFKRAGFYMKKPNCYNESHKAITPEEWTKNGRLTLHKYELEALREAEPVDGTTFKYYFDVLISPKPAPEKPADPEEPGDDDPADNPGEDPGDDPGDDDPEEEDLTDMYSTYKLLSPSILLITVATESDAEFEDEICKEPANEPDEPEKPQKPKKPKKEEEEEEEEEPDGPDISEPDDMLPEFRTISLSDRSGAPIEETLKDGVPVTLEWRDSGKRADSDKETFIDRVPERYAGLALVGILTAALIAIIIIIKRRRDGK